MPNMALNLAPFRLWTALKRRRLALRWASHMHYSSRLVQKIASVLVAALLLCGCATSAPRFPQDYYANRNAGDRIAMTLRLGMTMDEIRKSVAASELKDYVKDGPLDAVLNEDEILTFHADYARYPRDLIDDLKVGTQYIAYSYWITAHSNVALFLFFDDSGKLRGWANYKSRFNYERYWHERITSKLRIRTETRGMTRGEVCALLGPPSEMVDLPTENSRAQYVDHVWLSYDHSSRPPVRGRVKKLEVYTYPLESGGERRVYLGYTEFPRFTYKFVSKQNPRAQIPNPDYVGPQQDELTVWGYDHAWEEGERYMRENMERQK